MIKVLADRIFSFPTAERDKKTGQPIRFKTKIGFCELPDWVAKTDLFKMAVSDKVIQVVGNSYKSEDNVKQSEEIKKLKDEILALKQAQLLLEKDSADKKEPAKAVKTK